MSRRVERLLAQVEKLLPEPPAEPVDLSAAVAANKAFLAKGGADEHD